MNEKKESRQSYERRLSNGRDEANTHLLFAVVGHYINFLASDHPKVAADKYLFMKSFRRRPAMRRYNYMPDNLAGE